MNYDEMMAQGSDFGLKHCNVCGIDYEEECPSCNPRTLYHVEVGVACGPDDFTWEDCGCGCIDEWSKDEAIRHAKSICNDVDTLVRVCDDDGKEVWSNA